MQEVGTEYTLPTITLTPTFGEYTYGPATGVEFEAYKEALSDYLQEVKDFCSSRGVSYMLANTEKDVEKLLLERLFEMGVIK
jgi:hypothetical protein